MKFTYNWLKEYVEFDWQPEQLAERLTMAGIEVERIEKLGGGMDGVVVCQILASEKHPNADRLTVCRVTDGFVERQIVCGATNYRVGDKVPLALPNTKLPNGVTIKESKLRGVLSQGMLCSMVELGLGAEADGLMILSADAPVGKPLAEFLGTADVLFDVEVTPNRPDWLSILGIAREVSAMAGAEVRLPKFELQENGEPVERVTSVRVDAPELCPRYVARVVRGVKVGPSPDWLKAKLERVGLRSVNNVVDATNYVLMEAGQPLHAFDFNLLDGHCIVVRRAVAGERMTLIDGSQHELTGEMLVIADSQKPVALAGIMGGLDSEIRETTTDVLLESAYFHPPNVRATSKRLGVSSDSSYRFERGADIGIADWASCRAAALIQQLAGGQICRGAIDVCAKPIERRRLSVRFAKVNQLLGVTVEPPQVAQILNGLQLCVVQQTPQECVAEIPTFRVDIEREEDLVEEVCRIYGADKIPPAQPAAKASVSEFDVTFDAYQRVRQILVGLGFWEAVNQTLVSETAPYAQAPNVVHLQNPLAADQAVLRTNLAAGLLENLRVNVSRRNDRVRLFEIGRTFSLRDGGITETVALALAVIGTRAPVHWEGTERDARADFFDLKGAIEGLAAELGVRSLEFSKLQAASALYGQSAAIYLGGKLIGECGLVSPAVVRQLDLREPAYVAELQLDALLASVPTTKHFEPLPVYPSVRRDVAILVDETVSHAEVMAVFNSFRSKLLERIELFDIFRGKGIPEGKKSMAYSMTYRSAERTLTDEEVNRIHETLKKRLKEALRCDIRE